MRTPSAASCAKRIGIVARATPLGPKATLAQLLITQTALELLAELRELYGSFRIALTVADFRQPRIALALMAGDALLEAPNRPLHVALCEKDIAISAEPALHVVGKGANRLRTLDNRLLDDRILHNGLFRFQYLLLGLFHLYGFGQTLDRNQFQIVNLGYREPAQTRRADEIGECRRIVRFQSLRRTDAFFTVATFLFEGFSFLILISPACSAPKLAKTTLRKPRKLLCLVLFILLVLSFLSLRPGITPLHYV